MDYEAKLSPLAKKYIRAIGLDYAEAEGKMIAVDRVVSEVAGFYEKIRSAMEYQEEEVVLRSSIERILRRRLLFDDTGERIAEPLIRELAWAKYFANNKFPEILISKISKKINLYIQLKREVRKRHAKVKKETLDDWILQIMSADIAFTINPRLDMQHISNLMFHVIYKKIKITDDSENKDPLIFLNIKRAIAKEDKAFLRYELFVQYFGQLTEHNIYDVADDFKDGYRQIEGIFNHPRNERILSYIKRQAVPFVILADVCYLHKENIHELFSDEKLGAAISSVCKKRYAQINSKTRRAIVRSILFLFVTKALFALFVEGVVERFVYGHLFIKSLTLNTIMPPTIMFFILFFVKTPGRENTAKITERIKSILFEDEVSAIDEKVFTVKEKRNTFLYTIFIFLWLVAFITGVWLIHTVLSALEIDTISQGVFLFFLIVVSFLAYRINMAANTYNIVEERENFKTVLFNFLFMPFIHLGRRLTLSFSRLNVFLIIFDFVIETPFKTVFSFMEQWFFFLRGEREKLG